MFVKMEINKISDFVVKSGRHCFLCLSKVSPHLTLVKIEADADANSSSCPFQPTVFYAEHSLQSLSRYLKLDLGIVLKGDNKASHEALKAKLERSRLKVSLCEGCVVLNGRFSKLFQQLEKIQMEVNHCLSAIREKLTKTEGSIEKRLGNRLREEEIDILETLRREMMDKCFLKLDRTTPRVRLRKLRKQNLEQVNAGQVTQFRTVTVTEPASEATPNASVKTEADSQSEASFHQLDIEQTNIKEEQEAIPASGGGGDRDDSPDISSDKSFQGEHDQFEPVADKASDDDDNMSANDTKKSTHLPRSSIQKIHFKRNPGTGKFKCVACTKEFAQLCSAHAHYRSTHLSCEICGKHFSTRACLNLHHRVVHLKLKPYRCEECGKQFGWPSNLRNHRRRKHSNLKPSQQPDESANASVSQIDLEINSNSNNKYFKKNPDTGKFKCSACDEEFPFKSSVRVHYRTVHLKLKLFQCNICGKRFGLKSSLKTHHKTIHLKLKPHQCDECGKQFGNSCKLKMHQREVHLKIKPFKCDCCEKLFGRQESLRAHLQNVHLKPQPQTQPQEQLKQHKCDICPKSFSRLWALTQHHQFVHLNVKRHQCDHCSKKYSNQKDLRILVESVHLNIKYDCGECEKQFTMKCSLRRHLKKFHPKR